MRHARVDLRGDGGAARDAVEHALRQEDHVVGRRLRLGAGRRADLLEERVGLGQVDHARHPHRRRPTTGRPDGDLRAGARVQVGGGLLREHHPVAAPRQRAHLARKRVRVAVGHPEDPARSGALPGSAGPRGEPGRVGEGDRQRALDAHLAAHLREQARR